jgi:signal recognition particle subunit SRP54
MFDYLKKKLHGNINNISEKQEKVKEEIFNSLVEAEVFYDLAEKISEETIEEFKITNNYKKALYTAIIKNINTTSNNLKKGIMLFTGFQGHGKTTTINKLAYRLLKKNFRVAVATVDTIRPAAIEQLKENADRFKIPFIYLDISKSIDKIAYEILSHKLSYDYILVDTSGINTLYTDNNKNLDNKVNTIKTLIKIIQPSEIILVINSMLGHSMFRILENFKENIPITGSVMTNVDGDKKGGGFLSFFYIMKVPIIFICNGEKIHNLEKFNGNSIGNILVGEIDMEGLQDLIEDNIPKSVEELFLTKIMNGIFTFNELLIFTTQTNNIGLSRITSSLGMNNKIDNKTAQANIKIMTSVIESMTVKERNNQVNFNESRLKRISKGSGRHISIVKQIFDSYEQTKKQVLMLTNMIKQGGNEEQIMQMIKNMMFK